MSIHKTPHPVTPMNFSGSDTSDPLVGIQAVNMLLRTAVRNVGSIPTAPTSLLALYKGLAKSARQQEAAIRAIRVGR